MKYALVTGASGGIGRACSLKLASMGYRVLVHYRSRPEEAEQTLSLIQEAGGGGELCAFDVSDKVQVRAFVESFLAAHPDDQVEVLVNNAGFRKDNLMLWMTYQEWDDVLGTHLNGFYYVTQSLLQHMLSRKYGRIINMVSLSGLRGLPGQTNYSAAKGGIIAATKALAQEVARRNVTVNAVAPGYIRTEMTSDLNEQELKVQIPAARFGTPEEVAGLVGFLASREASYITGEVISVNGGLYT